MKPENILLSPSNALLADFGIARVVEAAGDAALTATGTRIGTPAYMSPEQAVGDRILDGRSDVYSLGCVLYEMLAGEPPHTGPSSQAIIAKRLLDPAPPVERCRPGLPVAVRKLVRTSLAPVAADRFASAGEFARAIVGAERAGSDPMPEAPPGRLRSVPRWAWGTLLACAVATGGLWARHRQQGLPSGPDVGSASDSLSAMAEATAAYRLGSDYFRQVTRAGAPRHLIDAAIGLFERAASLDTGFVLARVRLAEAQRHSGALAGDTGRINRAERLVDGLVEAYPGSAEVLIAKGDFQTSGDQLDGALRSYDAAARLRPDNALVLGKITYVQALRSDTMALHTGARAVALAPDDPAMLRRVIAGTSVFRRFEQLEDYSDRLIVLDPADVFGYLHKALVQICARADTAAAIRTLALSERMAGRMPMNIAWAYAMAGPAGWRRWRGLTLDHLAAPGGVDSLRYYWYHAQIASAQGRTGAARAYADSIVDLVGASPRRANNARWLAVGAYAKAVRSEVAAGRRQLADAEAERRNMPPNNQALFQTAFIAAHARLGDTDRAIAATRWLLEEPAFYTRRAIILSPEFHLLQDLPEFRSLLADSSLP